MQVQWVHFMYENARDNLILSNLNTVPSWPLTALRPWADLLPQFESLVRQSANESLHLQASSLFAWLLAQVLEQHVTKTHRSAVDQMIGPMSPAFDFMDQHYAENPTLEQIADAVDLHPVYFHRQFKKRFGFTPHHYVQEKRLELTRRLLIQSGQPLREISEAAGFQSEYYFSRAFKKRFDVSPGQYRKTAGGLGP